MSDQGDLDMAWLIIARHLRARAHVAEMELERLREDAVYSNEIMGMCRAAFMDTLETVVSPSNFDSAIRELGRRMQNAEKACAVTSDNGK